jgi:hypothetical protein
MFDASTPEDTLMATANAPVHVEFSRFGAKGLKVRVTGPRSLEGTIAYWTKIVERVAQDDPKCLLVLDELTGKELTPAQWSDLVQSMEGKGLEKLRIAHVKLYGLDHIEYCELYANIAGFDARAFSDLGEAERWLRYGEATHARPPSFQWARG